jgi:hypothetical protein
MSRLGGSLASPRAPKLLSYIAGAGEDRYVKF